MLSCACHALPPHLPRRRLHRSGRQRRHIETRPCSAASPSANSPSRTGRASSPTTRKSCSRRCASGEWYRRGGDRVSSFEEQWAQRLGAKHALATNGGTTALYAALAALEVGPGDEVIVPPYTFIATVNVVLLHHALPIFVDSDPRTLPDRRLENRSRHHPPHPRHPARPHRRRAVRPGHNPAPQSPRHRRRLPSPSGRMARQACWDSRRDGLLQLPGLEELQLRRRRLPGHLERRPHPGRQRLPQQMAALCTAPGAATARATAATSA